MTYVRYKFQKAISELSGDGSLSEHLINAYLVNLMHIELEDLPETVRKDFVKFKSKIIQDYRGDHCLAVESIVKHMDEYEVKQLVDALFKIYDVVTKQDESLDHVA